MSEYWIVSSIFGMKYQHYNPLNEIYTMPPSTDMPIQLWGNLIKFYTSDEGLQILNA